MRTEAKTPDDLFLELLRRFQVEGVEYVLIGGQAVRLNGFVRATEDVGQIGVAQTPRPTPAVRPARAEQRLIAATR